MTYLGTRASAVVLIELALGLLPLLELLAQVPRLVGPPEVAFGVGIALRAGQLLALELLLDELALLELSRLGQRIALVIGHRFDLTATGNRLPRRILAYARRGASLCRTHNSNLGDIAVTNPALIAAIAVFGIALAGCGSSKSTTSSSSASTTSSAAPATTSSSAAATTATATSSVAAGGSGAFKAAFVADRTQFRQLGTSLAKSLTGARGKTDAELAGEFQGLAVRAKAQAAKLSQLTPPAQFKPTVDKLVKALDDVGDRLQRIAVDAQNHNASSAKSDTIKLVQASVLVKTADTALSNGLKLPANS